MKGSRRVGIVASVAAVALLAACGSKGEAQPAAGGASGSLVIGGAVSLTGKTAREGVLTQEGYKLCEEKVNAKGGVKVGSASMKLEIKYQDDTSKPDTAAQLVDQFNDQGIKLVLGSYGSANTEAQAAVIERNNQVMVDSSGADDAIFQKGYKRTFAVLAPASEYAASIVKAISDLATPKPTTMAVLSADDGFSKRAADGAVKTAKEKGFTLLETQYFPNGATDVSSALNKIKGGNPQVVIGSVHLAEGVAIIKQSKELGIKPMGFGETVAPPTPDFVTALGKDADGVLGSSQWTKSQSGTDDYFGNATQYDADIKTRFGHDAGYHNAEASAACLAFVLAIQAAGSTDANKVRDALAALDVNTFFGKVKFDANGQNTFRPMAVIQIQGGKMVTVWPKDSSEGPIVWPGTGS
ncbi:MAG: amino acid ABC transporter substrate-binding protein [Dermatophilaceae bacterium]